LGGGGGGNGAGKLSFCFFFFGRIGEGFFPGSHGWGRGFGYRDRGAWPGVRPTGPFSQIFASPGGALAGGKAPGRGAGGWGKPGGGGPRARVKRGRGPKGPGKKKKGRPGPGFLTLFGRGECHPVLAGEKKILGG